MINLITLFAAESAESGLLGLNVHEFVVQLITFILAILVLMKFAVKPINKILDERRETIDKGVKLGEQMQKEQAELEKKVAKALRDARAQADEIIASAQDRGRQVVAEAEEGARKKAEGIVAAAEDRIKQDALVARRKLEKELVGLIAETTEAIIDEKVDAKKDASLINKALKERSVA